MSLEGSSVWSGGGQATLGDLEETLQFLEDSPYPVRPLWASARDARHKVPEGEDRLCLGEPAMAVPFDREIDALIRRAGGHCLARVDVLMPVGNHLVRRRM